MSPKKKRGLFFLFTFLSFGVTGVCVVLALQQNLTFFYAASDTLPVDKIIRLGGLVKEGSIHKTGATYQFTIHDPAGEKTISYTGLLPDLFREGQGVLAEGHWTSEKIFVAQRLLAKHDETYIPREVVDSLKKKGLWKNAREIDTSGHNS